MYLKGIKFLIKSAFILLINHIAIKMSKRNARARQLSNARKIQAGKHNNVHSQQSIIQINQSQLLTTTAYLELTNNNNF